MRGFVVTVMLAGCGRLGFDGTEMRDATGDSGTTPDAPPFRDSTGRPDPTFGATGPGYTVTSDAALDVMPFDLVLNHGRYLAIGVHSRPADQSAMGLFAYLPDGQPDPSFDSDGIMNVGPTLDDFGYAGLRVAEDRILVIGDGHDAGSDEVTVGLVSNQGIVDTTFGTSGFTRIDAEGQSRPDTGFSAALFGSDLIVCGVANYLGNAKLVLARLTGTGARVTSFGTTGVMLDDLTASYDVCNAVVRSSDGNVIAVGQAGSQLVIAAYTPTGARLTSFGSSGVYLVGTSGTGSGVVIAEDGDVIAVGEDAGAALLVRLAPDGTPREGFGTNGVLALPAAANVFHDIVVQPNGKLVLVGSRGSRGVIVRLLPDGTLDPGFATAGIYELPVAGTAVLHAVKLEPDGHIVAVGILGTTPPRTGVIVRLD